MTETDIILKIYKALVALRGAETIPVRLRAAHVVGMVQDDPFDCWVERVLRKALPRQFDIYHSGALTTPDLIVRDRESRLTVGIEVKKLLLARNGRDSRGMTLDYNSCLPCGKCFVKVGAETRVIPCFYLFALLSTGSDEIISLIIADGDFINYDFDLYKEAKYANVSEYCHGPYGEGSVRHRRMYTYPNPLNSRLATFYRRFTLILKRQDTERLPQPARVTEHVIRTDKFGNSFHYDVVDETATEPQGSIATLTNIFQACKLREQKERTAYIPQIPQL